MDERDIDTERSEETALADSVPVGSSSLHRVSDSARDETPIAVWWLAAAVVLLLAAFFLVEPTIAQFQAKPTLPLRRFEGATFSEVLLQRTFEALTVAWFFMLGASFGSFLHCLEYRMPRGISIVARGSSCPGCGTPIRIWHNVPVLGWLVLRGKCATCGWAIPARYAITEFIFGFVFALLMIVEVVGGGINLPLRPLPAHLGMVWNLWTPKWDLIAIYAYHTALLTFLMTWCLFACDRLRVARPLVWWAVLIGIASPVIRPHLHPLAWDDNQHLANFLSPRGEALVTMAIGAFAGLALGIVMMRRTLGNVRHGDADIALSGMLLVGIYLGWQAAVGVALLATSVRWLAVISPARRWPVGVWITLAAIVHVAAWRWLYQLPYWPGHPGAWGALLIALSLVAIGSWLLDRYERGGDAGPPILQPAFPEVPVFSAEEVGIAEASDTMVDEPLSGTNLETPESIPEATVHESRQQP